MSSIEDNSVVRDTCQHPQHPLDASDAPDASAGRQAGAPSEVVPSEVDALTRGLLGSFTGFIQRGAARTAETSAANHQPSAHPAGSPREERPEGAALDEALGRVEAAMAALVRAVPTLEERLTGVEARVQSHTCDGVPEGVDRDAVADGLKDRLASVERECRRLASVPIERIETRVATAERSLGSLVERAEAVLGECEAQRRAAEEATERLATLATALEPWAELLDLRESENGMPRPMAALLRIAGAELSREMAGVRGSLERFAGVLDLTPAADNPAESTENTGDGSTREAGAGTSAVAAPMEGETVAPEQPGEDGSPRRNRRKNGKPRAVRAKGGQAETPRRGASERKLSAEARLRARSRAEGRPPRRP